MARDHYCDLTSTDAAEAVLGDLQGVGIRAKLRPLERAAVNKSVAEKKLKGLVQLIGPGGLGTAARTLEAYVAAGGPFVYGTYPDIEGLWRELPAAPDPKSRGALLERIQRLVHDKAMFAPIWEFPSICAYGPRVAESGLGLIANFPFSAPYEDPRLKGR